MRRGLTVFLLVGVLCVALVQAADYVTYEALTVSTAAVGFATATLDPAGQGQMQSCLFVVTGAPVNFRFDGVAPTSSTGHPLDAGQQISFSNHADAQRAKFIASTGTDGVLKGHCWR